MPKIVQRDTPVLRKNAKEVPVNDIKSSKIQAVIANMKNALHSQDDGVAIAAPQIDESYRIFIVSRKVFALMSDKLENEEEFQDMVFINPEITRTGKELKKMEEGCLSVRYLYGDVLRSTSMTISAYDEFGKKFKKSGRGLLAQVFQHENDHLNGVLFIDKAENVRDLPPESEKK